MPTWDEITPYLERDVAARRWNAVNVLIAANVLGLVAAGFISFFERPQIALALQFDCHTSIRGGQVWQFLTYTFWHPISGSGNSAILFWGVLDLALGCYILHVMGRDLEMEWGWRRFTTFYVLTGIYGAVAHAIYQTAVHSRMAAFDFLGPVLSVFLVWALKGPERRIALFFLFPMRAITAALLLIGLVVLLCIAGFNGGITPAASLGSVAAAYLMFKLEPKFDAWLDTRETRQARERFLDEFELKRAVDAILDKINREGMDSLTSHQKRLLKRASRLYSGERDRHE